MGNLRLVVIHRDRCLKLKTAPSSGAAFASAIHLAHDNIHTAKDHHYVRYCLPEAKVLQNRQVDKARRAHSVTIGISGTVADQIKTKLALRTFDAPIGFSNRWFEGADFHLRVHDRACGDLRKRLLQDSDALSHFQDAHHQSVVAIAMFPERHSEFEAGVESVAVDLADVVIHSGGAKHRPSDASTDRQLSGKFPNVLGAGDENLVFDNQLLEFVQKPRENVNNLLGLLHPPKWSINPAAAEPHVVAHHA